MNVGKCISRASKILVLLLTLVVMLLPSVTLKQETYGKTGGGLSVFLMGKGRSEEALESNVYHGIENRNVFGTASGLLDMADEVKETLDFYEANGLEKPGELSIVQATVLTVCAVLLYVVFLGTALALAVNIALLIVTDICGKRIGLLKRLSDFMKGGLLAAWGVMLFAMLFGMGHLGGTVDMGEAGKLDILMRFVFTGANYLLVWVILVCVRIAGAVAGMLVERRQKSASAPTVATETQE
ncbi:MAG: hypothetical protein IJW30_03590 [Clostridia bacterium]|nr:hypothetical protein [Clostridia bacterium]